MRTAGRANSSRRLGPSHLRSRVPYLPNSDPLNSVSVGNVITAYTPDSTDGMRLAETKVTANGTSVFDENISANYYANDQRHTETVTRTNPGGGSESHSTTFSYNSQDELTGVTDYLGGGNYSYTFDNAGNRAGTSLGTANSVNEYSGLHYNGRGDLVDDGTNSYGYDGLNRLISVTPDAAVAGSTEEFYGYDSQGRRIWKQVDAFDGCNWNLSNSREYVWDTTNLVAELDGNNTLLKQYTWGPTGLLAVTDYTQSPAKTYVPVADASGNVLERFVYDPYGTATVLNATTWASRSDGYSWVYRFQGGRYDANTGLYNFRLRDYSPSLGRWVEADPIGYLDGMNRYQAMRSSPPNVLDPTGLIGLGENLPDPYGPNPTNGSLLDPSYGPVDSNGQPMGAPQLPDGRIWLPVPPRAWGRRPKWKPSVPIPGTGGGQPETSWDPNDPCGGHWDYKDGKGGSKHYDKWGQPLTPDQAHGKAPRPAPPTPPPPPTSPRWELPSLPSIRIPAPTKTGVIVVGGVGIIIIIIVLAPVGA